MADKNRNAAHGTALLFAICLGILVTGLALPRRVNLFRSQPAAASDESLLYLPVAVNAPIDLVQLQFVQTLGEGGDPQQAFDRDAPLIHRVSGTVLGFDAIGVSLTLSENGPCGAGILFSETLTLGPGPWQIDVPGVSAACSGIYSNSVVVVQDVHTDQLAGEYVVNDPFGPVPTTGQGFDRCVPPTVEQLAAWWQESPYSVVNIYLGGVHYPSFCQTGIQDAIWVHKVASQGWTFTAIWVGPQPPCTNFTHKMSPNPATAYLEGRDEAEAAADKARALGLFGDLTIHYDVEGYFGNEACREVVESFVQGWTDRLHELGLKAGSYGGGCSSSVSEWWLENDPAIDQVWIAHWSLPAGYNPDAVVWGAACVDDDFWPDHQRIKQYAGDHAETWGGTTITIDSNVFDTSVIGWTPETPAVDAVPHIVDFGPLGPDSGWLQLGGRLFRTGDLGLNWEEITPPGFAVLGTAFLDGSTGFTAGWPDGSARLHIGHTEDGGMTWSIAPIGPAGDLEPFAVAETHIEILDGSNLWVALKLPSGSAFSLGRLFASADGGATWEERTHPLGEPVAFETALMGWTAGGPAGTSAYQTLDGGVTWTAVEFAVVPGRLRDSGGFPSSTLLPGTVAVSTLDGVLAWALVQQGDCSGEKGVQICGLRESIWVTSDGGAAWIPVAFPALEPAE